MTAERECGSEVIGPGVGVEEGDALRHGPPQWRSTEGCCGRRPDAKWKGRFACWGGELLQAEPDLES